jgi:hypothetical protein
VVTLASTSSDDWPWPQEQVAVTKNG